MPLAGTIGYAGAAAAFLLLAVLLAAGWEGRSRGLRLIGAAAVTALWTALLALFAWRGTAPATTIFVGETLVTAAWLAVVTSLAGQERLPGLLARLAHFAWIVLLLAGLAASWFLPDGFGAVVMTGGLGLALLGLVLLEQLFRNANASGRWVLRYLYLGAGGLFVYNLFVYSQGLLLGSISPDVWQARGFVMALTVPFLAIAARRNPDWSLRVFVSRDAVFYATSLLAVGVYLLLTAAGGWLVRLFGGSWGVVAQIVFFAAALGLLGMLIGSTTLRRQLRVFLVKHFYRNKYDYREEWLRFIATLSDAASGDPPPVTAVRAVAQIIGSPRAALLLCDERPGQWRVAAAWPGGELFAEATGPLAAPVALREFLEGRQWVIDLPEWRSDPEPYAGLELPEWIAAAGRWRLVVPVLHGERLTGLLLLADPPGSFQLTFEDRDLLKTTARHVATHLAQHESEERLAEHRQFAAYSKLASFMMHDLKNATAQLELVVANAARHRDKPEFIDDAIETVAGAVRRIQQLIAQLQQGEAAGGGLRFEALESVQEAVRRAAVREPRPLLAPSPAALPVMADRERLTNVLEHLIRNAQEAAGGDGRVEVAAGAQNGEAVIEIRDNGPGMTAEFVRERLFRPFDSTKGSKGMGIGAFQAREYIRSLQGWIDVDTAAGRGTTVRVVIPLAADALAPLRGVA